jgi:hypothetical protein
MTADFFPKRPNCGFEKSLFGTEVTLPEKMLCDLVGMHVSKAFRIDPRTSELSVDRGVRPLSMYRGSF